MLEYTGRTPHEVRARDEDLALEYHLFGVCPVQALGTWRNREIYFRARHGLWTFEVADLDGVLPTDGGKNDGHYWEGNDPHMGYMPFDEASVIIQRCIDDLEQKLAGLAGSARPTKG